MLSRLLLLLPLAAAACSATDNSPVVDRRGIDVASYEADLAECRAYANQVDAGKPLLLGAVAGAVGLAAFGALFGDSSFVEHAVGSGLVAGSTRGAEQAIAERNLVLRNCLSSRGYTVFN